ncbi:Permease of the drug/metabolite transporter (DMT) superfamily [Cognatiyoonia sediminum]|uniref:Permease of the drug/metabolite transporter (DMT) superfamily n=1 Tax=Cognatiyoonia sediminum TaxID=1508389 RepID=A0A1M5N8T5_9RHOB|nr:DMT family transporter [Cognatiyoonia sediminum]SHG85599.1 Permease of the drug/metabolite transporter (DMT) superfamily [Cognatiyoonia sediminum]
MTTKEQAWLTAVLIGLGALWGLSQPLVKIAVAGQYEPLGMVFIQMLVATVVLGLVQFRRLRRLPIKASTVAIWLMIAFVGTIIPNSASYQALKSIPSGIYSVLIATIPMMSFPIALAMRNETYSSRRLLGLAAGFAGVLCIVIPDASLPERAMLAAIPLAMLGPLCYALEGNLVAKFGTAGMDPIQVMFGASALGAVITLPIAINAGQLTIPTMPLNQSDVALIFASVIHSFVYVVYVWMVGRAGPLFAAQVSYWVTGFGVLWAMLLLGERYAGWVWFAMVLMALGLTLVQPRRPLASNEPEGDTVGTPSA